MKNMIFLLVSTVALLLGSALTKPLTEENHSVLNEIVELALQYNKTQHKALQDFVEDVSNMASDDCNVKFLCKVRSILETHNNVTKRPSEFKIVKNLGVYISETKKNCTDLLEGGSSSGSLTQIRELLDNLIHCVRKMNYMSSKA